MWIAMRLQAGKYRQHTKHKFNMAIELGCDPPKYGVNIIMTGEIVDGLYGDCGGSDLYRLTTVHDVHEYKTASSLRFTYLGHMKVGV